MRFGRAGAPGQESTKVLMGVESAVAEDEDEEEEGGKGDGRRTSSSSQRRVSNSGTVGVLCVGGWGGDEGVAVVIFRGNGTVV